MPAMFRLAIRAIPNVTLTVTHVIPRLHSDTLVAAVESAMKKKKLDLRTGTDELLRRLHVITTLRLAFVLILDRRELCSYLPNSNLDSNLVRTSIVPLPPNVHHYYGRSSRFPSSFSLPVCLSQRRASLLPPTHSNFNPHQGLADVIETFLKKRKLLLDNIAVMANRVCPLLHVRSLNFQLPPRPPPTRRCGSTMPAN